MKKIGRFLILLAALLAFEIFNFSVTQYAIFDLIGPLTFAGIAWASIFATAFCLIDLGGIARLFTPEDEKNEPGFVWYLFGAWFLAAGFNAILVWWGVKVALVVAGTSIPAIPIVVAVIIFIIRVLLIGTFASGKLNTLSETYLPKGQNPEVEIYSVYKPEK